MEIESVRKTYWNDKLKYLLVDVLKILYPSSPVRKCPLLTKPPPRSLWTYFMEDLVLQFNSILDTNRTVGNCQLIQWFNVTWTISTSIQKLVEAEWHF